MSLINSNSFLYKTVDGVKQFFSPLVNASTVVLKDGSKLEKDGKVYVDQAVNADTLGGKEPKYYIQPRNLLDNSDFRNPVNQRGITTLTEIGYCIDRWLFAYVSNGTLTVNTNSITIKNGWIYQFIENLDTTKMYTLVWCDDTGYIYVNNYPIRTDLSSYPTVVIENTYGRNLVWTALYEGSYTAETLPPYIPKGYANELLACSIADTGRVHDSNKFGGKQPEYYLRPRNLLDNSDFRNPVNQRNYTSGSNINAWTYNIDRWRSYVDNDNTSINYDNTGAIINGSIAQKNENSKFISGNTYTLALYYADGLKLVVSGVITFGDGSWKSYAVTSDETYQIFIFSDSANDIGVHINNTYSGKTKKIIGIALYEGEYTAGNLPPYVPKGYAAELVECRRYYLPKEEYVLSCYANGYLFGEKFAFPMRLGVNPTPVNTQIYSATWDEIAGSNIVADYLGINRVDNEAFVKGETYRIFTAFTSDL